MKKVNVLGAEYSIEVDKMLNKTTFDGLCFGYEKRITIRSKDGLLSENDSDEIKRMRMNEVLRHEIIHAFFNESGLEEYSDNEQLVDWIALQSPKIFKAFQEAECL